MRSGRPLTRSVLQRLPATRSKVAARVLAAMQAPPRQRGPGARVPGASAALTDRSVCCGRIQNGTPRAHGHDIFGVMKITRYDGYGQELRPGLRSTHQHNLTTPTFTIDTILEAVEPDRWRAEVRLFGEAIIDVPGPYPTSHAAGTSAEEALRNHLVSVFRAST